ncbi:MAG: c-type cytochrome [Nitrospirales bacterium]|nr:c-type cytochrome [Nitrospirales bacterium]
MRRLLMVACVAIALTAPLIADGTEDGAANVVVRGRTVYREQCVSCHGVQGDGRGEAAASLSPLPQNFTTGVYKFRSTMSGQLPTDDDLFRTITIGIAGTAMDRYAALPEQDRRALVAYLKSLSPRFAREEAGQPIAFPASRPLTPESVARGRAVYERMQCAVCHGDGARGDGPLAADLSDTDGLPIRPADLTRPQLKGGRAPESVFRSVMAGLDGTPMPSYGDSLIPDEAWDLALYIFSLSAREGK